MTATVAPAEGEALDEGQERAAVFIEASAAFSESLDYHQTLRRVAELVVPRLADWCSVTALDDRGPFERIAVVHRDPAKEQLASEYEATFPKREHRGGGLLAAVPGKEAVLIASVCDADLVAVAQDDDHLRMLRDLGCASCLMVPMVARGKSGGVISLVRGDGRRPYGPEDVSIARELAYRAGLAVECARLYREARRREETIDFLADASTILSSSLDCELIFAQLARLVVPALADWYAVDIEEGDEIRQVAVSHVDPTRVAFARGCQRRYPPDPEASEGAAKVLRTGISELYETISALPVKGADDEEHLRMVRAIGLRSALIVPLVARGKPLGTLTLGWLQPNLRYRREDVMVMEDLGRRAGLAIENTRLYQQGQMALQLREEFLSLASHELKTPLTGLQLQVNGIQRALAKSGPLDLQKVGAWVEGIDKELGRFTDLVVSLLDVTRSSAESRLQMKTEDVDLAQVVRDVVERFREELATKKYTVSLDIEGPVVGRWDRLKLDEIVTNFLTNAISYGARKPIAISVRREAGEVTIEVLDQGIGISLTDQVRIFRRFSRVVSSQHYGGFGLGLWSAKVLVEAMGGRVDVQSLLGTGSSFRATFPIETKHGESQSM